MVVGQMAETWGSYVKLDWLKKMFMNVPVSASDEEIQHASRTYLLYLLDYIYRQLVIFIDNLVL